MISRTFKATIARDGIACFIPAGLEGHETLTVRLDLDTEPHARRIERAVQMVRSKR